MMSALPRAALAPLTVTASLRPAYGAIAESAKPDGLALLYHADLPFRNGNWLVPAVERG